MTFFVFVISVSSVVSCGVLFALLSTFKILLDNSFEIVSYLDRSEKRFIRKSNRKKGRK